MKQTFDIVIGNPPFRRGLHMKFLEFAYKHANGFVVFVHPSTGFVSIKPSKTNRNSVVDLFERNIKSLTLVNGNALFNAGLFVPCSVTLLDKTQTFDAVDVTYLDGHVRKFNSVSEVNLFGRDEVETLIEKVKGLKPIEDLIIRRIDKQPVNTHNKFVVCFTGIRGNVSKDPARIQVDDFWTLVSNDVIVSKKSTQDLNVLFDTEFEANNFLKYVRTKFARRMLSFCKTNVHLDTGEMRLIPIMDWSVKWTDEKIAKHFNLSEAEISFINELPDY